MEEGIIRRSIAKAVDDARKANPLAGSITNNVTIDFVANAQLAVGGSAAMVYLPDEGEFLAQAGGSAYINMGTLIPVLGETIPGVARALHEAGKPCVIDPVGLGIGALRTRILQEVKPFKPSIIRGNASEIIGLAGLWELDGTAEEIARIRGVDATDSVEAATVAAVALARYTGGAVAVSGAEDLVTDGKTMVLSAGGSHFMSKITGCGCSLGGVMAVYAAVTDPFTAALTATAMYNLAGTRAENVAQGPASFKVAFIDALYNASAKDVSSNPFAIREA